MATTQETTEVAAEEALPTAKLHPRWAMGTPHMLIVMIFGAIYLLLNYVPLRCTDIWGHVDYGHWIIENRSLPTSDPWMPLAEGMQVIDSASQSIFSPKR